MRKKKPVLRVQIIALVDPALRTKLIRMSNKKGVSLSETIRNLLTAAIAKE